MGEPENSRKEAAAKIIAAPNKFKICESCGSIVVKKADVCPNCNAYRFDESPEAVITQAELLAARAPLSVKYEDYN
jgi:RNA polymerase subunit RPABC4/transcription elongation factor Spt4